MGKNFKPKFASMSDEKYIRPSWDEYFMEIARAVAKRSTCDRGREHHGCVIVREKQILATGYVGSPPGLPHCDDIGHLMKTVVHEDGHQSQHCMRTNHMELNAICQAAKRGVAIDGSTMYVQYTPCATCAKVIITAGIRKVVCEKRYHQATETEEMFKLAGIELTYFDDAIEKYDKQ
jgi:dCMP deaminase